MAVFIERRISAAATWARRLAVFSAVLLVTAGAGHRGGVVETPAFFWLLGLVVALSLSALVLAAAGFLDLWERGDRGGKSSALAVLVALVVLVPFGIAAYRAFALPRMHDISTDTVDAPAFLTAPGLRDPTMNPLDAWPAETAPMQVAAYPDVTGRRYALPAEAVQDLVVERLLDRGWRIIRGPGARLDTGEATIEAVARSFILGFVSDVVIRITDEGETTYVDMRSASRFGVHDIGKNAAILRDFLSDLDAEVVARGTAGLQPVE